MKIRLVTMGRFHTYHQQPAQNPSSILHEGLNVVFGGSSNNPLMWEFKGGDLVLKAWKRVADDFPHAMLHVCARPPKRRFFRLFQMLDGNDILPQAKYFDLLRRADVFVRPEKHTPAVRMLLSQLDNHTLDLRSMV